MIIKHTPNIDQNSVTAYVEPKHWKAEKGPPPVQAITITMENFLDGQLIQGQIPAFVVDERTRQVPECKSSLFLFKFSYLGNGAHILYSQGLSSTPWLKREWMRLAS